MRPAEQPIRETDTLTDIRNLHNDNNATFSELLTEQMKNVPTAAADESREQAM